MALGERWIETRTWATAYRGPLAIHAAHGFTRADAEFTVTQPEIAGALVRHGLRGSAELPLGAVIAIAQLVDVVPVERVDRVWLAPPVAPGPGRYPIGEKDQAYGDFSAGRFAWILGDVRRLPEPVPAPDAPGLWDWQE